MSDSKSVFTPPEGAILGVPEGSGNNNFRWEGQRVDGEKTPEAALRARRNAFANIEQFEAWRRSKGMPDLVFTELAWAYAKYRGEPTTECAVLNPVTERRTKKKGN